MINKKVASAALLFLAAVSAIVLLSNLAHCAIPSHGESSIGNVVYQNNPLTYKAGNLISYNFIDKTGLVLTLQPLGTYELFQESVFVCANPRAISLLDGKHNPLILAYENRAHRQVEGIGCHELTGVYEIKGIL